ncbi:MAG: tetratricopeptide repeat protein [Sphingobacteriales bacterium]|nr:MAG: tetratricopeptide repeat protein [Sphingobacteriales bacterium]
MKAFDFREEVLDLSYKIPVVVDFWAPWCGPCKFIGPILEDLAKQAEGVWNLVKINTDEFPEIADQYDVRGIPAIKMIFKGLVKSEFVGALPKNQIEKWLTTNLPDKRQESLEEILKMFDNPQNENLAIEALETFSAEHPAFIPAQLVLAEKIVWKNPVRALELVKNIGEFDKWNEKAEDIRSFAALAQFTAISSPPSKVEEHLSAAKQAVLANDTEKAITELIEAVSIDKNYMQGLNRKITIAFFRNLGIEHPLSVKYRHKFDRVLY